MDYCDEIISIKSLDFKYLDCNTAFLKHFGFSTAEEVLGKSIFTLIPKESVDLVHSNLQKVLKEKQMQSYSFRINTNNKVKLVQQTSTPVILNGEIKYILTISRDVTQDQFLKENLLYKTMRFDTLMQHLPLLVYMKDKDKNYIIGSKFAKEFVDFGIDSYANNVQINMSDAKENTEQEDNYVLKNKTILKKEKQALDKQGNNHWYRIIKAPIINNIDGSINGLITIARNIDYEKHAENQKDLFIATLVHDLKNPLLAQISGMKMLKKIFSSKLNDDENELLETILESADYMKEMLYTMINTYKYDCGNVVLDKKEVDIEKLINTCIKENLSLAKENNIKITFNSHLKKEQKLIKIDERQMRRVFVNLLNNGINYAFSGSKFEINTKIENNTLKIEMTNFGPTIDDETKEHLFEKYIPGRNKYQKVGFGLGMYLSKKVMEAHNGDIYHIGNNEKNTFIITFPIKNNEKPSKIKW